MKQPSKNKTTSVPWHGSKEVPTGTAKKNIKTGGVEIKIPISCKIIRSKSLESYHSINQSNKMNKTQPTIKVIVEVKDDVLWGIVEGKGDFIPTPYGETITGLKQNLKELVSDYQQNEGKKDKFWSKVDANQMDIEISFDLQAFFKEFYEIKISALAESADLNPSLLRQYATGHKYPSADQVKKIELAVQELGKKLKRVSIYA